MAITVYEAAVYYEKNGTRTLRSRHATRSGADLTAEQSNRAAKELGILPNYVAVDEYREEVRTI